ncbi:LOW QUALITY PROTEIN: hypothetical protein Cgig2_002584 [Carnegiea gigantea]|uniref:Aminotransferase-like plant mobile domain-containing protein n=1 Tax=Carnegiea gigantea TaxID=171969 RepID=A0A9Q1GR12_9CARY|nr:LOW QUALITY PROTEIN: hypothetical protein Cgig2_002584 [Carnegiea gigantea]
MEGRVEVLQMERTHSKRRATVDGDKGETASKRHRMSREEEEEALNTLRRESHRRYVVDEDDDGGTSSGSDYMGEGSAGGGSTADCVSLESESDFGEDVGGGNNSEREGTSRRRGKRVHNVPKVEVVWKYLEEVNLMDSSGSDFEGGADGGGDDSPNASFVSNTDLDNVSDIEPEKGNRSTKVVPGQQRRGRRKAAGDGVVFGKHPLKGKKCGGVTTRRRSTIERVVSLNEAMSDVQKEAMMGTVLRPILNYRSFAMEQNLALALLKCWVPHSKAFRLADRLVPFSVFDILLLIGLPVTGEWVDFDDDKLMTDFGDMRVHEEEQEQLRRRKVGKGRKDKRVYKNFIAAMMYLCEKNTLEEQLELWLKLYTWLVLSILLFPRTVYGAAWELQQCANDVQGMSCYAWAEAVWQYMVYSLDDMQRRLCNPILHIQFNGFSLLIQVWFYEHTTRFHVFEKQTFS